MCLRITIVSVTISLYLLGACHPMDGSFARDTRRRLEGGASTTKLGALCMVEPLIPSRSGVTKTDTGSPQVTFKRAEQRLRLELRPVVDVCEIPSALRQRWKHMFERVD